MKSILLTVVLLFVVLLVACGSNEVEDLPVTEATLTSVMELSPEQEEKMLAVFSSVNMGEILHVEEWEFSDWRDDGSIGFVIQDYRTSIREFPIIVWIDENSKEVMHIIYRANTLFYQGEHVAGLTDDHISRRATTGITAYYRAAARTLLAEFLDTPEIPSTEGTTRNEGNYIVFSGHVTSLSDQGTRDRKIFQIVWDHFLTLGEPLSIIIDEYEVIRQ